MKHVLHLRLVDHPRQQEQVVGEHGPSDMAFFEFEIFAWHAWADKAFDGGDTWLGLTAALVKGTEFFAFELSGEFFWAACGDVVVDSELGEELA